MHGLYSNPSIHRWSLALGLAHSSSDLHGFQTQAIPGSRESVKTVTHMCTHSLGLLLLPKPLAHLSLPWAAPWMPERGLGWWAEAGVGNHTSRVFPLHLRSPAFVP